MIKSSLTFTLDRQLQPEGQEPIRLALTLNAWTSREQADVDEQDVKTALAKASAQISADVFGDVLPQVKESCGDCRFFDRRQDPDDDLCRRHPPHDVAGPGWPAVTESDWCGEYERKAVS